jgi:hypothetical protein
VRSVFTSAAALSASDCSIAQAAEGLRCRLWRAQKSKPVREAQTTTPVVAAAVPLQRAREQRRGVLAQRAPCAHVFSSARRVRKCEPRCLQAPPSPRLR